MIELKKNFYRKPKAVVVARFPRLQVSTNGNIYIMTSNTAGFRFTGPGENYVFCDGMATGSFMDYEGSLTLQNEED